MMILLETALSTRQANMLIYNHDDKKGSGGSQNRWKFCQKGDHWGSHNCSLNHKSMLQYVDEHSEVQKPT